MMIVVRLVPCRTRTWLASLAQKTSPVEGRSHPPARPVDAAMAPTPPSRHPRRKCRTCHRTCCLRGSDNRRSCTRQFSNRSSNPATRQPSHLLRPLRQPAAVPPPWRPRSPPHSAFHAASRAVSAGKCPATQRRSRAYPVAGRTASDFSLSCPRNAHTFEGILAQWPAHCYRLENSTLPSVSVGTPLHVAGRYLHVRTVCRTRRSPASPALSSISGLCTRPSVPMMKLTLTLRPFAAVVKSGSGVVSACGGSTAAQAGRELICGTSMY